MARKRKHGAASHMNPTVRSPSEEPPALPTVKFGEFKLTTNSGATRPPTPPPAAGGSTEENGDEDAEAAAAGGGWERAGKRQKKAKRRNVPEMVLSPLKLRSPVKIGDLQNLVLWLVADGVAPQWLMVRHKPEIKRAVVLLVPGLTMDMFDGTLPLTPPSHPALEEEDLGVPLSRDDPDSESESESEPPTPAEDPAGTTIKPSSVDNFWPHKLTPSKLPPCLQDFATMFEHVWPIKTAGDDKHAKLISPISSFLNSPLPKGTTPTARNQGSRRIGVSSLLMTPDELAESEYLLHSSQWGLLEPTKSAEEASKRQRDAWVETDLSTGNGLPKNEGGAVTEGKTILSIDCEMVQTTSGHELSRISILSWDNTVLYDTLVKPSNPITDYLTQYSGMTSALLDPITTTLADVQTHLLTLINADTILLGQSLNSDLNALRFAHPHIIDTSVIYHHTKGPPYKPSLRWLAQRFLHREIQSGGAAGHDSIEDAKACLDLLKMKLEKGATFGTAEAQTESVFKRLERYPVRPRKGAVVDYGQPEKWYGAHGARTVAAKTDADVADGVVGIVGEMDFTWGRFRALETLRGWHKTAAPEEGVPAVPLSGVGEPDIAVLAKEVGETVALVKRVYDGLPRNTALIVYSGTGDPREMRRYMDMQREFRAQYKVKKWDELTVKWTDVEEQALREAVKVARGGVGLLTVKV